MERMGHYSLGGHMKASAFYLENSETDLGFERIAKDKAMESSREVRAKTQANGSGGFFNLKFRGGGLFSSFFLGVIKFLHLK